jgi:hypothetical protein
VLPRASPSLAEDSRLAAPGRSPDLASQTREWSRIFTAGGLPDLRSVARLQAASRASQWRDRAGISPASLFSPIHSGHPKQTFTFSNNNIRRSKLALRVAGVKRTQVRSFVAAKLAS